MDDQLIGESKDHTILKSYSDITEQNSALSVMTLNSLLANKLSLLIDLTRNEPRDLYDIWFLLNRINEFEFNAEKVSRFFKDRFGVSLNPSIIFPELIPCPRC